MHRDPAAAAMARAQKQRRFGPAAKKSTISFLGKIVLFFVILRRFFIFSKIP
jgi:hypothetical protein